VSARLRRRTAGIVAVGVLIVAAFTVDQLTKFWALTYLGGGRTVDLALGARLELVFNPGVAFGIGASAGAPLVIGLMAVAAALTAWVFVRAARGRSLGSNALLAVAAGGGLGNIWDRVSRSTEGPLTGEVVDFIAVDWFAIFNVADIFTTCGIIGWALLMVFRPDAPAVGSSSPDTEEAN
jgi:signal peptidase II